ncbi:MAG: hypothetical protein AAF849_08180 [Bacteroidota bacterium]
MYKLELLTISTSYARAGTTQDVAASIASFVADMGSEQSNDSP